MYDGTQNYPSDMPQIDKVALTAERYLRLLTRLNAACVEVLDWAYAQDEDLRPAWVERLEQVMEERP